MLRLAQADDNTAQPENTAAAPAITGEEEEDKQEHEAPMTTAPMSMVMVRWR